jgi:hypothetical protein
VVNAVDIETTPGDVVLAVEFAHNQRGLLAAARIVRNEREVHDLSLSNSTAFTRIDLGVYYQPSYWTILGSHLD